nr:hypothetical protein [Tanacetum cinerariifolium]
KNVFNHYFWEDGTYLEFMPWAIDAISGENADVTLKRELERESIDPWEKEVISDPSTPKRNPNPFDYIPERKTDKVPLPPSDITRGYLIDNDVLDFKQLETIRNHFLEVLMRMKHNGAIDKKRAGFTALCNHLLCSDNPRLNKLTESWMEQLMESSVAKEQIVTISLKTSLLDDDPAIDVKSDFNSWKASAFREDVVMDHLEIALSSLQHDQS